MMATQARDPWFTFQEEFSLRARREELRALPFRFLLEEIQRLVPQAVDELFALLPLYQDHKPDRLERWRQAWAGGPIIPRDRSLPGRELKRWATKCYLLPPSLLTQVWIRQTAADSFERFSATGERKLVLGDRPIPSFLFAWTLSDFQHIKALGARIIVGEIKGIFKHKDFLLGRTNVVANKDNRLIRKCFGLRYDPLLESRSEFMERVKRYMDEQEEAARLRRLKRLPLRTDTKRHISQLVMRNCLGMGWREIAERFPDDNGYISDEEVIRTGVASAARLIGLEVRKGKPGRPKKK